MSSSAGENSRGYGFYSELKGQLLTRDSEPIVLDKTEAGLVGPTLTALVISVSPLI